MRKLFLLLSFLFIIGLEVKAQNVYVTEDATISTLMDGYAQIHKSKETVSGWRIQILATTDRMKMEKSKEKFLQDYPQINVDWIHAKPYYKVRVGAFSTKLEAQRLLYMLKKDYPSAYPAKDNNIRPGELVGL